MFHYLNKVLLPKFLALFLLFSLSSCKVCEVLPCNLTKSLWFSSYKENFKYFLVSKDGQLVVFLGDKYHYVLQDQTYVMQRLLKWRNRDSLFIKVDDSKLTLDLHNNLRGHIKIETFYTRISTEDFRFLYGLGFRRKDSYSPMYYELKVMGKRYLPRSDLGYNIPSFKRTYKMNIYYETGTARNIGKAALTPVTVAADATLVIGNILLFPFRGQ